MLDWCSWHKLKNSVMEKFINTKKEQFLGFDFLKNHTLPSRDVFDYRVHKKEYSEKLF